MNTSKDLKKEKEAFYSDVIKLLNESNIPYLLGGTYAVMEYTGIQRETKDIDFFCKSSDYPRILNFMKDKGYDTSVKDERFVAKIQKGKLFADLIMGSFNSSAFVDDTWFDHAPSKKFLNNKVRMVSPEDLILSYLRYMSNHEIYITALI